MYDVIIIGAGVTGTSVAYQLSRRRGKFLVLEAADDVCSGTSKANTAIIHGGYDAKEGSMKAKMNLWGSEICEELAHKLDFPYQKIGSIVVCRDEQDREKLEQLYERGMKNGVKGLKILSQEELREMEPHLCDAVVAGLYCDRAAITDPFLMNIAFAEQSHINGVQYEFHQKVTGIEKSPKGWLLTTEKGSYETRAVVNAAGVYADEIHNMVSEDKLHIHTRRGEYLLLDKDTKGYVNHVIFDLPTGRGKGIVVTPTVDGNTLVGPTAKFVEDKNDRNTTREELDYIVCQCEKTVKNVPISHVITSFSGLRAHEEGGDFILKEEQKGFFDCVGIESPGLSSAPAIGIYMADLVDSYLHLPLNEQFAERRKGMIHTADISLEEHQKLIEKDCRYGQIICRCEKVTEGEIVDAIHRPLGARTLDGIKRRTRSMAGRCQGGFCLPRVMEILCRELNLSAEEIRKNTEHSYVVEGRTK